MRTPNRSPAGLAVSVVALLLVGGAAATEDVAASERLLIAQPGYPGSTQDARAFIDRLRLEIRAQGGPEISAGSYHNRENDALAAIRTEKPTLGVVSLGFYLAHRKALFLRPLLWSRPEERYHVLVKKGAAKTLADLKGRSITGTPFVESEFIRRVVLSEASAAAVAKSWKPQPIYLFSKGVRDVRRGRKDAVLLSERELNGVKKLRSTAELEVIHTTLAFPVGVVVTIGKAPGGKLGDALTTALVGLERSVEGRDLLKTMGISGLTRVDAKRLKALEDRFDNADSPGKGNR